MRIRMRDITRWHHRKRRSIFDRAYPSIRLAQEFHKGPKNDQNASSGKQSAQKLQNELGGLSGCQRRFHHVSESVIRSLERVVDNDVFQTAQPAIQPNTKGIWKSPPPHTHTRLMTVRNPLLFLLRRPTLWRNRPTISHRRKFGPVNKNVFDIPFSACPCATFTFYGRKSNEP